MAWNRVTPRQVAMAAALAVSVGLVGCGGEDPEAAAIRQAKIDMQNLAATYQPGQEGGTNSYDKVISSLSQAAESSAPGEATAARLIRAQAYIRQGEESAARAARAEREAQRVSVAARGYHNQWLDLQAQASALEKYDPKGEIAQIDQQIAARDAEIAEVRASLTRAEQELAGLRREVQEAQAQSQSQRDEEMNIRSRMMDKSQTERAELVRLANEAKRKGDAFDLKAADTLAQVGRQLPAIAELQLRIQRLEAQKLMLDATRQSALANAQQARVQAARARDGVVSGGTVEVVGAKQVGEQLAAAVGSLNEARAGIQGPHEEAMARFDKALSEVQRAKTGGGGGARAGGDTKLIEASVHHARADLFLSRAHNLESHAALMELLAGSQPAIAGASGYSSAAKEAEEQAAQMLASAKEAFTSARELYEGAGQSQKAQDVKERLELIARELVALGATPGEGTGAGDAGMAQAPDTPGDGDLDTVPADGGTPDPAVFEGEQAKVFELVQKVSDTMKRSDYDALISHIVFRNARQEENFRKIVPLFAKNEALDKACEERFGRGFDELLAEYVGVNPNAGGLSTGERELERLRQLDVGDLDINVLPSGTDAEIRFKSARTARPLEAMKIGDEWKIKMDFELETGLGSEGFIGALGKALDTVTENIRNGKYGTNSDAMFQDLFLERGKAIQEALRPSDDENK